MTPKQASPETINSLAESYVQLKAEIAVKEEQLSEIREHLVGIALVQGSTPARAEKTTRVETPAFTVDVRQGHSFSIDQKKVETLKRWLDGLRIPYLAPRLFKKLFRTEERYFTRVSSDDIRIDSAFTASLSKKEHAKVLQLFSECVVVTPNRPSLEVKRKEVEK